MPFLLLNKLSKLFVEFNYDVFEKKLLTNNLVTFLLTLMYFNALIYTRMHTYILNALI